MFDPYILSPLRMMECKLFSIDDLSHLPKWKFQKNETAVPQITFPKTENATTNI